MINKKILILADSGSIHTRKWLEMLKPNYTVVLVSFSPEKISGVQCINLNLENKIRVEGGNAVYLKKLWEINRIIKNIKPDLINAHYLTSYGFIAALLKRKRIPLVLSVHGTDIMVSPQKNIFYRLLTIFTLKRADHIFSVAKHMTEEMVKYVKLPFDRITTIQYGVNIEQIREYRKDERDIDFISTRNLYDNSNIDIIIKAFEKYVKKNDSCAKLYISGEGYLKGEFEEYIKANSLSKNIVMTGHLSQEKLFELLGRSKFYISMTSSDGTSLSLLEAVAAGCIPLVSDIDSNRYWVRNGVSGYTIKIDIEELFARMGNINYNLDIWGSAEKKIILEGNYNINSQIIAQVMAALLSKTN